VNSPTGGRYAWLVLALCAVAGWSWQQASSQKSATRPRRVASVAAPVKLSLDAPPEPFPDADMLVYRRILVAYSTGDFDAAMSLAQQSMEYSGTGDAFRDWLMRQIPVLMTSQGWMRIKTQDCDEAIKIFYRVLGSVPVPEAQKGLGFCLRVAKSWPEAAGYLATYILAKPEDVEGRFIYADTLESLGRFQDAVQVLEGAAAITGLEPSLAEEVKERWAAMKAKAKSGLGQKTERSEHFYVSYREDDHEAILRTVLDILEAGLAEYSELLGFAPPATAIEVILYRKDEFIDVLPGGPGWAEGVFDGRMRVPVAKDMLQDVNGRLATVLRHELSHALLAHRSSGRAWPTWFDEGVAQYLSCRGRGCDRWSYPATPGTFSASDFLIAPFVTLDPVEAGRAYLHSLFLTKVLVRAKGESVFDFLLSRVPQAGSLSSDFIAQTAGWESFDSFYTYSKDQWKGRPQL
jgi:hypothetical protein